jgi:hypothetical protein
VLGVDGAGKDMGWMHGAPSLSASITLQFRVARISHKNTAAFGGWKEIAKFLGQPIATAQRWAKSGMPVASPEELSRWMGRESGLQEPVHIATDNADLTADLKRGLSDIRHHRRRHPSQPA